jgi:hypothetical protein
MSAFHLYEIERFFKQAESSSVMSLDALLVNFMPFDKFG